MALTWVHLFPSTSAPTHRTSAGLWDGNMDKLIVPFTSGIDDVYIWDGTDWSVTSPANFPTEDGEVREAFAFAASLDYTLTFTSGATQATWKWDGTNYVDLSPATTPDARQQHALGYHPNSGEVVMFGGRNFGPFFMLDDTLTWDGSDWTLRSPANTPPGRSKHAMAQTLDGDLLLFGGIDATATVFNDTWLWDGTDWTELSPATPPSARNEFGLTYNPPSGQVILFGGSTLATPYDDETWAFKDGEWTELSPATSPAGRFGPVVGYDGNLGVPLLMGGDIGPSDNEQNDTWILTDLTPLTNIVAINSRFGLA